MSEPQVLGIPWYNRQDYNRVLEIMEDSHKLPSSFDQWLRKAEETEKKFQARGTMTVRVQIDPDEFVDWCRTRGLNVDNKARSQFANETAVAQYRNLR